MPLDIRLESPADHRCVEELTRLAFWNLYIPGCEEHWLVHRMRTHEDFIPELALVAVEGKTIVGSIMHTRSRLSGDDGSELETLTFGPLGVHPDHQRKGIGRALVNRSVDIATARGVPALVIEGHPTDYCCYGFRGSDALGVADDHGKFAYGLLVRELIPGSLSGRLWRYRRSPVYDVKDPVALEIFDQGFPPLTKGWKPSQEVFRIADASVVHRA